MVAVVPAAQVTKIGILDMQVCVPKGWSNRRVLAFAEAHNPCGTSAGWGIRKKGSRFLAGCPARVPCEDHEGFVHIMLDA